MAKKKATGKKLTASSAQVHEALDRAFQANVARLYDVYLDALVTGGDIDAAKDRFKRGLKVCKRALKDTKALG